jgi:5-formyltetrahydrofolate cyclo-ligase
MNNSLIKSAPRQLLRKAIREKRQSLSHVEQKQASVDLLTQLKSDKKIFQAQHIAIYLANDSELDAHPFIEWCWQQQKSVYLPVIHPFSAGQLLFLKYNKNTKMQANQYGINEPKLDITAVKLVNNIDIMFTPLVAFDQKGNRLGMGGGFYDRTLARWYKEFKTNKQAKPYPIGLAHNCQKVDNIPCEIWDIPLPEIITPDKHYEFIAC